MSSTFFVLGVTYDSYRQGDNCRRRFATAKIVRQERKRKAIRAEVYHRKRWKTFRVASAIEPLFYHFAGVEKYAAFVLVGGQPKLNHKKTSAAFKLHSFIQTYHEGDEDLIFLFFKIFFINFLSSFDDMLRSGRSPLGFVLTKRLEVRETIISWYPCR